MDRSLFPSGVEVGQAAMQNQTQVTAEQILQRFLDQGQSGVTTGLTVSVSANTTQVDVAAGRGYAPGGEMVELTGAVVGKGLADYTSGVDNYVCVVYAEVTSRPEAHAFDGTTRPTVATRSARVSVYTLVQLNALPATSDDMTVDSADRTLVVGIVNANGAGVPLLAADITNALVPIESVLSAPMLVESIGIEIVGFTDDTTNGTTYTTEEAIALGLSGAITLGHLTLTTSATPYPFVSGATHSVRYQAPRDGVLGPATFLVTGTTTIPTGTIGANGFGAVVVRVTTELLPRAISTTLSTDSFAISRVYQERVSVAGARDELHRRTLGGNLPTSINPHGARVEDLEQDPSLQWGARIGDGLLGSVIRAFIPRLRGSAVPLATSIRTLWQEILLPGTTNWYLRVYFVYQGVEVTLNARYEPTIGWFKDDTTSVSTKIMYDQLITESIQVRYRVAGAGSWSDAAWGAILTSYGLSSGNLSATGAVSGSIILPTAPTPGVPQGAALYSANFNKAQGRVTVGAAGPTLVAGSFNLSAPVYVGSLLRVTFPTPLGASATNVIPSLTCVGGAVPNLVVRAYATTTTTMDIEAVTADTSVLYNLSAGVGFDIAIVVTGEQ